MKIHFLDLDDVKNPLLGAGQAITTYELGGRLVKLGHEVTVICSKYPGYKNRWENGMFYKHIGITTGNIQLNNLIYILSMPFVLPWIKTDLFLECFTAPISTLLSPLWTKTPVAIIPSSFEAKRFSQKYHIPFDLIERWGAQFYTYLLAFSTYTESKMKVLNPKIVSEVIAEGVNEHFFTIKRKTAKHILFVGRFDIGQKGIDLLLKAYAKIADKTKYPLIIVGFGPDEEIIKKMIKDLHLETRALLVGPAYGEKKYELLSQAACVVLPSRDETFSCFSLEAMASGNPIVTFNIPGLQWIQSPARKAAKPFDVDAYADTILMTLSPKMNIKMSKEARTYAKHFTWDTMAEKYDKFFTKYIFSKHI